MKRITFMAAVFVLCAAMLAGCRSGNEAPSTLPSTTGATLMPTTQTTAPSTTQATVMPTTEATLPGTSEGTTDPTGQTGTPNGTKNARGRRGMNRGY